MAGQGERLFPPGRLGLIVLLSFFIGWSPQLINAQNQIDENFPREDWQPTRAITGGRYLGSKACAACHVNESATQPSTPMAHALSAASDSEILRAHPHLSAKLGRYSYQITTEGNATQYTVSDGTRSVSGKILWAFGLGGAGQSYLYQRDGSLYEFRVSYFNATSGLDLTLGVNPAEPQTLEAAAGRPLRQGEISICFACHATGAVGDAGVQLERMTPGITCEGCHGPGGDHLTAVQSGQLENLHIFNPGKLQTADLIDFCGSCHRTSMDVANTTLGCAATIRFQPYRLVLSRCSESGDPRIRCLACHNPHEQVRQDQAYYDSKCLACHAGPRQSKPVRGTNARKCSVASTKCVTCHMPRYELPGGHISFTDHDIQITHSGAPCRG